jgi:hypothetical protein
MGTVSVAPWRLTTVPLHDVTIRWKQPDYFSTEWPERQISGADLGRVLTYIGRCSPNPGYFLSQDDLREHAELVAAIGELCRAMKNQDDGVAIDTDRVLWVLETILADLGAHLATIASGAVEATATVMLPTAGPSGGAETAPPANGGHRLHVVPPTVEGA